MNLTVDQTQKEATGEAKTEDHKDCGCGCSGDCQKPKTWKWALGIGVGLLVIGLITYRIRKAR